MTSAVRVDTLLNLHRLADGYLAAMQIARTSEEPHQKVIADITGIDPSTVSRVKLDQIKAHMCEHYFTERLMIWGQQNAGSGRRLTPANIYLETLGHITGMAANIRSRHFIILHIGDQIQCVHMNKWMSRIRFDLPQILSRSGVVNTVISHRFLAATLGVLLNEVQRNPFCDPLELYRFLRHGLSQYFEDAL